MKTQKFTLEESNQNLEDNLRASQDKINYLLRELANRNNFIKDALHKKQNSQQSSKSSSDY